MATLSLPPAAALDQALTELTAASGGEISRVKALRKARFHLADLRIVPTATGFLVPSGTRTNIIHEVSFTGGCSCEASGVCWHQVAVELIEQAQRYTLPTVARFSRDVDSARAELERIKAKSEMAELFN
jgi:hypothetical protein